MEDNYSIDLEKITLERFQHMLETKELLPGRMILKEQIDERFGILESMGIDNLQELWEKLKTQKRVAQLAEDSGLREEYLIILRREVSGYMPKPVNLKDFPDIDAKYIERLASLGIKTTKHLFDRVKTESQRAELSEKSNIPVEIIEELTKLSDLVRIVGVGPVFAQILYEAGIDNLEVFVSQSPQEILEKVQVINASKQYTKANITEKDIVYCLETASLLPQVIEYG